MRDYATCNHSVRSAAPGAPRTDGVAVQGIVPNVLSIGLEHESSGRVGETAEPVAIWRRVRQAPRTVKSSRSLKFRRSQESIIFWVPFQFFGNALQVQRVAYSLLRNATRDTTVTVRIRYTSSQLSTRVRSQHSEPVSRRDARSRSRDSQIFSSSRPLQLQPLNTCVLQRATHTHTKPRRAQPELKSMARQ